MSEGAVEGVVEVLSLAFDLSFQLKPAARGLRKLCDKRMIFGRLFGLMYTFTNA
jgi:hypothetical protein